MRHELIVGAGNRAELKLEKNTGVEFPKQEAARGEPKPGPRLLQFQRFKTRYLLKDFTPAASSSFTSKTV